MLTVFETYVNIVLETRKKTNQEEIKMVKYVEFEVHRASEEFQISVKKLLDISNRKQEIKQNDTIQLQKATEKSKKKGEDVQKSVPSLLERMGYNKTGF